MFFSVLTFTFSTGAQATKLLKSFLNATVNVVVRENEVNLITSSPLKNTVTIGKDTCFRWEVLPELFNMKEEGAHVFTIDLIDQVTTAVQSMSKTSPVTFAFVSRWDTFVSSKAVADILAKNISVTNPKMVMNIPGNDRHMIMFMGEEYNSVVPVKTTLSVQEFPTPEGHCLGTFAARRRINRTALLNGNCTLRFYADGEVRSHISKEPEVQREEPIIFNFEVHSRVLSTLVNQCMIEKDAVANMKYIPGSIVAEISCSSSFISYIFIPIADENLDSFLSMAVGYLADIPTFRTNIGTMALAVKDGVEPEILELETFTSMEKLDEDCELMCSVSESFVEHLKSVFSEYNSHLAKFKSFFQKKKAQRQLESTEESQAAGF